MANLTEFRPSGHGLHPRHYDARRGEILRMGAELSDTQLSDLAEALKRQVQRRRPRAPTRRSLAANPLGSQALAG